MSDAPGGVGIARERELYTFGGEVLHHPNVLPCELSHGKRGIPSVHQGVGTRDAEHAEIQMRIDDFGPEAPLRPEGLLEVIRSLR